jgi:hypothetical protein
MTEELSDLGEEGEEQFCNFESTEINEKSYQMTEKKMENILKYYSLVGVCSRGVFRRRSSSENISLRHLIGRQIKLQAPRAMVLMSDSEKEGGSIECRVIEKEEFDSFGKSSKSHLRSGGVNSSYPGTEEIKRLFSDSHSQSSFKML